MKLIDKAKDKLRALMPVKKAQQTQIVGKYQNDLLIKMAVNKDLDIEKLKELIALKRGEEERQAKQRYFEALALFQSRCPVIEKNKKVSFPTNKGRTEYCYAPLEDIILQVKNLLEQCGFSYSFFQDQQQTGIIKITCTLHHKEGHEESATLEAHADGSGNKNAIQSIASTVTYLRRYTFCGITGITTADTDDDGQSYQPVVSKEKVEDVEVIKENPAKELGEKLIKIMATNFFTKEEKEKFKIWLSLNKGAEERDKKLGLLTKEYFKRKDKEEKVMKEAEIKFDQVENEDTYKGVI